MERPLARSQICIETLVSATSWKQLQDLIPDWSTNPIQQIENLHDSLIPSQTQHFYLLSRNHLNLLSERQVIGPVLISLGDKGLSLCRECQQQRKEGSFLVVFLAACLWCGHSRPQSSRMNSLRVYFSQFASFLVANVKKVDQLGFFVWVGRKHVLLSYDRNLRMRQLCVSTANRQQINGDFNFRIVICPSKGKQLVSDNNLVTYGKKITIVRKCDLSSTKMAIAQLILITDRSNDRFVYKCSDPAILLTIASFLKPSTKNDTQDGQRYLVFNLMKFTKIILLLAILLVANSYTEQNHVLILTAQDFPNVLTEFPQILIEFYAPWCGHCKKLTPIYDQVAKQLHEAGSPVRLAKIDADAHSSVKGTYEVKGFPTLIYFSNGQQIKYNGQRSKEFMVGWLNKKTRPAVTKLEAAQLDEILHNGKVKIVFYGDLAAHELGSTFEQLANADDYNTYYNVQGTQLPQGTVHIFRPFGQPLSTKISSELKIWISQNERPVVYAFDDRTIGSIFGERAVGVILFQMAEAGEVLNDAFAEAAQKVRVQQGKQLIFTSIEASAEHYGGLANYIKIITEKSPIVLIDGGKRTKFVLSGKAEDLDAETIVSFVMDVEAGKAKEYKIDEEVEYADGSKVEDQL